MQKNKYLQFYLLFVLLLAILELFDNSADFINYNLPLFSVGITVLFFVFYFVNILAFLYFRHSNLSKLTLILPLYYIFGGLFTLGIGFFLSLNNLSTSSILQGLTISSITFSLLEIIFASYLYKKLL